MSRRKLLLLTLGISSGIHLALAAAYLWLDNTVNTPSARAVVEISLQPAAVAKAGSSHNQAPEQSLDEKLLDSQQDNVNQHRITDTHTRPEAQTGKPVETETQAETLSETSDRTGAEDNTVTLSSTEEQVSREPTPTSLATTRAGEQNAEHNAALEAEKQNYLGLVTEHINSYKYYPRNAIRRGTEGQVEVSFDLQVDGSIENLRTRGEHSVLLSASQRSIEQALPMPQRTENLLSLGPIHIEFSMKYFLHEQ